MTTGSVRKEKLRARLVAFLGAMGCLLIVLAVFQALEFFPITDFGTLRLLLFLQMLSLGITELCVAWLIHTHISS